MLKDGETKIGAKSSLAVEQIANAPCRGGWPAAVVSGKESSRTAMNYVGAIINMDIQRVDGIEKDPERARVLLQSLARNISTLATAKTIMDDMQVNEASITDKTLNSYLNALRRLFVIEDVAANLIKLSNKVDAKKMNQPSFLMVLTGGPVAYKRSDGVLVVPVGCLKD